ELYQSGTGAETENAMRLLKKPTGRARWNTIVSAVGVSITPADVFAPPVAVVVSAPTSYSKNAALDARSRRITQSIECFTWEEVSGEPSWNVRPGRRWYVYVMPSAEIPPFATVGTTVASPGFRSAVFQS